MSIATSAYANATCTLQRTQPEFTPLQANDVIALPVKAKLALVGNRCKNTLLIFGTSYE